jgi:glycosyltransferase involved in cell wall biosynthesis
MRCAAVSDYGYEGGAAMEANSLHIAPQNQSERTLRIAYFNSREVSSGAEDLVTSTIENIDRSGLEVRLYVRIPNINGDGKKSIRVYQIPYLPGESGVERRIRFASGLMDCFFPSTTLLSRDAWLKSADVWHFHNLHGNFISIPLLAAESRNRLIVLSPVDQFLSTGYCAYTLGCERYRESCGDCPQLDKSYSGISRDATRALLAIKKLAIKKSKFHLLVHTDYLAMHYASTFVNQRSIERIYYGVNTRIFRPLDRETCAAKLSIKGSGRFVVGLMHSWITDRRKGLLPLMDDLRRLAANQTGGIHILVVGNDSESAREYATPSLSVSTLPFQESEDELSWALNLCDVLLYPTKAENLSLTCLKALACGVPVISSNIGGQNEALRDGVNGFLCEPGRNDQIVARVAQLMADDKLVKQLSVGSRQTAVKQFDLDLYGTNLIAYYKRLVQSKNLV